MAAPPATPAGLTASLGGPGPVAVGRGQLVLLVRHTAEATAGSAVTEPVVGSLPEAWVGAGTSAGQLVAGRVQLVGRRGRDVGCGGAADGVLAEEEHQRHQQAEAGKTRD